MAKRPQETSEKRRKARGLNPSGFSYVVIRNGEAYVLNMHISKYDEVFEEIKQVSETVYIISGKANVDKVLEVFDIEKDIEPVTVNGWIAEELKTLPTRGTKLRFENLNIEVIKMKGRRIDSIKVTVLPKEIIE